MVKSLKELETKAKDQKKMRLVLVAAHDKHALSAVLKAQDSGIVEAVLVGDEEEIRNIASEDNLNLEKTKIINEKDLTEAANKSAKLIANDEADFIMKGKIDTSIMMKSILNKEFKLRTDNLLTHVMTYEIPKYHKLLMLTDGGMVPSPSFDDKKGILKNAVDVSRALGNETTNVSCLAAKEKVSEKMPATVEGDKLKKLAQNNEFGSDVVVEGPIAFDLAVSKEAADIKGYESPVAGNTDVLLVPTIEVGNGIGKALTYMSGAESAGIIMGAKVPIVLVSRADTERTKFYSIALGSVIAANKK